MEQQIMRNFYREVALGTLVIFVLVCFVYSIAIISSPGDGGDVAYPQQAQQAIEPTPPPPPIRIFCAILTVENSTKIKAVERTWARRCDKFLKIIRGPKLSETDDSSLSVPIERESRDELWHKMIATFSYLYTEKLDQFDWFLKADDDTYFLVDNLRHFLTSNNNNPDTPVYYGHKFKPFVKQGYMSGGSGYILSREALRRLYRDGFAKNLEACDMRSGQVEDVEMGKCLEAVQVEAGDTRDSSGRETFLPLSPKTLLSEHDSNWWYWSYNYYFEPQQQQQDGNAHKTTIAGPFKNCCSNRPISFHYITPEEMYLIDWLLYDVQRSKEF